MKYAVDMMFTRELFLGGQKMADLIGSRYPVSYWGEDRIDIGCQKRSIDQWLTDYAGIAAENNFTEAEIAEYRGYVEFIQSVHLKKEAVAVGESSNSSSN